MSVVTAERKDNFRLIRPQQTKPETKITCNFSMAMKRCPGDSNVCIPSMKPVFERPVIIRCRMTIKNLQKTERKKEV